MLLRIKTKMATSMKLHLTCIYRVCRSCTISCRALHSKLSASVITECKRNNTVALKRFPVSSASVSRFPYSRLSLSLTRGLSASRPSLRPLHASPLSAIRLLPPPNVGHLPISSASSLMTQCSRNWGQARAFSSGTGDEFSSSSSASDGGEDEGSGGEDGSPVPDVTVGGDLPPSMVALSPMTVPEVWPQVPVIAVRRHPLFPRFIKMIEVVERGEYCFVILYSD